MRGPAVVPFIENKEPGIIDQKLKGFERFCKHNAIEHRVNKELDNFSVQGLKTASRQADLLIPTW